MKLLINLELPSNSTFLASSLFLPPTTVSQNSNLVTSSSLLFGPLHMIFNLLDVLLQPAPSNWLFNYPLALSSHIISSRNLSLTSKTLNHTLKHNFMHLFSVTHHNIILPCIGVVIWLRWVRAPVSLLFN